MSMAKEGRANSTPHTHSHHWKTQLLCSVFCPERCSYGPQLPALPS